MPPSKFGEPLAPVILLETLELLLSSMDLILLGTLELMFSSMDRMMNATRGSS
jgi:hypothetical protein